MALTLSAILRITGTGVPAGANSPNHTVDSKPGRPASLKVGKSMPSTRFAVLMASRRTRPLAACCINDAGGLNIN